MSWPPVIALISLWLKHRIVANVVNVETLKNSSGQKAVDLRYGNVGSRADRHYEREIANEMRSNLHILSFQNSKLKLDAVRSVTSNRRGPSLNEVCAVFRRIQQW